MFRSRLAKCVERHFGSEDTCAAAQSASRIQKDNDAIRLCHKRSSNEETSFLDGGPVQDVRSDLQQSHPPGDRNRIIKIKKWPTERETLQPRVLSLSSFCIVSRTIQRYMLPYRSYIENHFGTTSIRQPAEMNNDSALRSVLCGQRRVCLIL